MPDSEIRSLSYGRLLFQSAEFHGRITLMIPNVLRQKPTNDVSRLVDLTGAMFGGGGKISLDASSPGTVNFARAEVDRVDLTGCTWPNNMILMPEEERGWQSWLELRWTENSLDDLQTQRDIYMRLKTSFERVGDYTKSGEFYYRQKECERRAIIATPCRANRDSSRSLARLLASARDILKHLFWQLFYRGLVGYGERPINIVAWSMALILLGSFWYHFGGIGFASDATRPDLWECLYLSVATFTTLSYGDVRPIGWSKPFAMLQAFAGMFMMALFSIVYGRKVMRG